MFSDRLAILVTFTVAGTACEIPGGSVRALRLALEPWGFSGEVTFRVLSDKNQDEVLPQFVKPDLARVEIELVAALPPTGVTPPPLSLVALVTRKSMMEESYAEVSGNKVYFREYTLAFADAAQVLWRQHHPLLLAAQTTIAAQLGAQVVEGISLDVTHSAAQEQRPHVCLPLGESRASFYDFLAWYASTSPGVLYYDYAAKKLVLADAKAELATPAKVRSTELAGHAVHFPALKRYASRVMNAYALDATTEELTHAQVLTGLRQDHLVHTSAPGEVSTRRTVEEARLANPKPELELEYRSFPMVAFWPNTAGAFQTEFFSTELFGRSATYRIGSVSLDARVDGSMTAEDWAGPSRVYSLDMRARWEASDDLAPRLPPFTAPQYPVRVEGMVVCDEGAQGDRTYAFEEPGEGSWPQYYRVKVPLWADAIVRVPYEPMFLPGHIYTPTYRDSRVLLALELHTATIERHLDWGPDVQLPADGQGNQILFGKNRESQTQLKHDYLENKPVLMLYRVNAKDTELLQLEDGALILQTKEEA